MLTVLALLCWMLAGCTSENVAATQVLVVINSDLQVGTQLTAVEVEIQSADGSAEKPDSKRFELSELKEEGRFRLPLSFGVVPGAGGSDNIRLIVRGYGPGAGGAEVVVVEQKSLVTFERGSSQRLTVFLGGACFHVLCPNSEETCYPSGQAAIGVCTPVSEAALEKVQPGDELDGIVLSNDEHDAGSDGGKEPKEDASATPQGSLTVTPSGDGVGTVTSSVPGIDCGTTCSGSFDLASAVTLTATAGDKSQFTGWTGGTCAGTDPCVVTIAQATTITATFVKTHYPLHVTMSGDGVGVVSSGAAEISCGSDCEETFPRGAVVQLTAATTTGTVFLGWNGGGCSGAGTCSVTVNAATDVSAIFACTAAAGSQSFGYTGAPQALTTRPLCKKTITVDMYGAAGGYGFEHELQNGTYVNTYSGVRGYGGRVQATLTLGAGDTVTVVVGGTATDASASGPGVGGYNGGGNGAMYPGDRWGGGGGGSTDIRLNVQGTLSDPATEQLDTRVLVAGGGGGGIGCYTIAGGIQGGQGGGVGGNPDGAAPTAACYAGTSTIAGGGTQTAGGLNGHYPGYAAADGVAGKGGDAGSGTSGGGGGGGYYGGGGGAWEAGAGGSSYAVSTATGVTFSNDSSYSGYVTISW